MRNDALSTEFMSATSLAKQLMTLASLVVPPGGQGGRKVNYVHSQSWKPHLTASQSTLSFKQGHAATGVNKKSFDSFSPFTFHKL